MRIAARALLCFLVEHGEMEMGSFGTKALWSLRPSFWARWRRERGVEIVGAGQERGGRSEVLAAEAGRAAAE